MRRGCTGRRSPGRLADNRRSGPDRAANARRTAFRAATRGRDARSPSGRPRAPRARAYRRRRRNRPPSRSSSRSAGREPRRRRRSRARNDRRASRPRAPRAARQAPPGRVAANASSPFASASGTKPSSTLARKKPIQTLEPISRRPSASMPSFQSPALSKRQPVLGEMAKGEGDGEPRVLVDRGGLARGARDDDPGLLVVRHGLAFEEGRHLVEHARVARRAHVARQHVGQPQVRIARLGALAEAGAAVRRAMPPFQHVAFEELLGSRAARSAPASAAARGATSGRTSCKLVAVAGRAAALVRPDAAPEPRGVELIGQPGVDEPVEVRPVGADLDLAEPRAPRRRGSRRGRPRPRRPKPAPPPRAPRRGSSPGRTRRRSGPLRRGRSSTSPAKAATRRPSSAADPSGAPVSTIAGVWMSRPGPPKKRVRTVSVAGEVEAGRGEGEAALEVVHAVLKDERRADRLVADLADALVRALLERHVEERDDAQPPWPRAGVAQGQDADVARPVRRNEDHGFHLEVAAALLENRDARLVGRPRASRPRAGTARSPASRFPRRRGRGRRGSGPAAATVALPKRKAVRPFWRALAKAEKTSPSFEVMVDMPSSFAITCAHGRGVRWVRSSRLPSSEKRERPAGRERVRRLDGAGFVDAPLQVGFGHRPAGRAGGR